MAKFTKQSMSNAEGLQWIVVSRDARKIYYCMNNEQADKWIKIEQNSGRG